MANRKNSNQDSHGPKAVVNSQDDHKGENQKDGQRDGQKDVKKAVQSERTDGSAGMSESSGASARNAHQSGGRRLDDQTKERSMSEKSSERTSGRPMSKEADSIEAKRDI